MTYSCRILADSISPLGIRLVTMEIVLPRIVLAEFNTHRQFSRNSASSRAIPVEKMLRRVQENPFVPIYWGKNQKGMQAERELTADEITEASMQWLLARDLAVERAEKMLAVGVHKQITNRLLEPWLWHTIIVTATEWENFFALRCHKDAQPEIRKIALMMREQYETHEPVPVQIGDWHLPLCNDKADLLGEGFQIEQIARISCARCARVSYLTHDGKRDPSADLELADRLQKSGHMSPLEHAATPLSLGRWGESVFLGNFRGWQQYRKLVPNESVFRPD